MKKSVKISKKTGIALFVTAAVIMALLIVFHKNPGPAVDQSQELAKKIISCVVIAAACFAFIKRDMRVLTWARSGRWRSRW